MDPMTAPFCSMFEVTCEGSQFEEDSIVADILGDRKGTYVDVGASHPIECSNTWKLYQRGWFGLLIEPNPKFWWGLLTHRPRDILCPLASSDSEGFRQLHDYFHVSSLVEGWAEDAAESITVQTQPIRDTLARFPEIRDACLLCSIDVEGHEREVLAGIDWGTFRPHIIVIEYRDYNPHALGNDTSGQWSGVLTNAGYDLFRTTALNHIWRKRQ